jgi:hypothetical protein
MSLKYSVYLSTGFVGELASFKDPREAYETLTHVAQTADELGFETVWLLDHFHTFPPSQAMFFESWTTAAAFARDTRRVCKIREEDRHCSGLKSGINEVSSTVSNELWRQKGCYVTWNGQRFTI